MNDSVNHPSHYKSNGMECIDAMIGAYGTAEVASFCKLNAFKYIWRCCHKGKCVEDIEKAIWYLNKFKEIINND